ncbi:MAG: 6-hydroxymethylpterin diphosphokinase MptE-like protein [Pseudomonadota bacterium]
MADSAGPIEGLQSADTLEARYQAALAQVPFRAPIYLPTDRVPLEQRASGMEQVARIHNHALKTVYASQLKALRRKHAGQRRAFIIGNGPSLNQTDLSQLKDEVTFCVNGFFLKMDELDWTPTYYVVEDHLVAEDRAAAINALTGPVKLFPAYLAYCLEPGTDTIFFNHRARKRFPEAFDFSTDASEVTYTGCTVTFTCMQLAHYLGFQELYLIGVDASYDIPKDVLVDDTQGATAILDMDSEDPNHFHPDYFGKGMRWHDPQVDKMLEAYGEARVVADRLGRPIYNATVGGALEVFERRAFNRIFPAAIAPSAMAQVNGVEALDCRTEAAASARTSAAETAASRFPRLLLLDAVPPGRMTATGELKSTLFGAWPDDHLLHIAQNKHRLEARGGAISPGASTTAAFTPDILGQLANDFGPELILFRPIPDRDAFNDVAFDLANGMETPLALWIVDDWPTHLASTDPDQWARLEPAFRRALDKASLHVAISGAMADAFETRYGKPFIAVSNAVDPRDWPTRKPVASASTTPFRIRYSGGLSAKMTLQSLIDIADAVETLSLDRPVKFEINTRAHWKRLFGDRFSHFRRTRLTTQDMDPATYREWLCDADLTAVVYNFDQETIGYTRYSMANKTVECLASGAPPLVYGPSDIHTIAWLEAKGLGVRASAQGPQALGSAITDAVANPARVRSDGETARAFAFKHRALDRERDRFCSALAGVAARSAAPAVQPLAEQLNEDYRKRVLAAVDADEAASLALKPVPSGRTDRMIWFYKGWRGVLAGGAVAAPLLAFCLHAFITATPSLALGLLAAANSVSFAVMTFFAGYLFTLIEDYSPGGRPQR